jgi:glycosyltransferase involved in cell wall biosynthesis
MLAGALQELADNPELCRQMGKNASELAQRQFDRVKLAGIFEKVLIEAISKK